jgi:nucleotide-binding universal stress UspA family protein
VPGFWSDFARKPLDVGERSQTPHYDLKPRSTILVPTDFSPASLGAVDCAVRLALKTDSRLIFLHVVYLNLTPYGPGNPDWLKTALRREAHEKVGSLTASTRAAGVDADCLIEDGTPRDVISRVAARQHAQIIIMATARHSALSRFFRQKTVEHVVRDAYCPVLVLQTNLKEGIL